MIIRGGTVSTPIKPERNLVKATNLNEEEKAQARDNIGAASADGVKRNAVMIVYIDTETMTADKTSEDIADWVRLGGIVYAKRIDRANNSDYFCYEYYQLDVIEHPPRKMPIAIFSNIAILSGPAGQVSKDTIRINGDGSVSRYYQDTLSVTYDKQVLTEVQQAQARTNIGAAEQGTYGINIRSLDNGSAVSVDPYAVVNETGYTTHINLSFLGATGDEPVRLCHLAPGENNMDAATVGQLNEAVGNIETTLDSIIAIQESLIGGAAE